MEEHRFGGAWTEIKLEVLRKYLNFYTKALKEKGFELLYIDAFAGTGSRTETLQAAPTLGEEEKIITYDGSARIALKVDPSFDKYLFIECDKKRVAELEKLKNEFANQYIRIENTDANKIITDIAKKPIWDKNKFRGVIFIDPYGLEIDWTTLEAVASTKSFDVWFLFSISGVYRQASLNFEKMEDYKKKRLTKIFGTDSWKEAFYKKNIQTGFFETTETLERALNVRQIEEWVGKRLKDLFPFVSNPLPLPSTGSQLYSLFFCVSNPSAKAKKLAQRVVNDILKRH